MTEKQIGDLLFRQELASWRAVSGGRVAVPGDFMGRLVAEYERHEAALYAIGRRTERVGTAAGMGGLGLLDDLVEIKRLVEEAVGKEFPVLT